MNKKADLGWEKIMGIILVFLFALFLILGGGKLIGSAKNAALGVFGLINITEVDYSQLNKDAKSSFDTLIKDLEVCKNSKDSDCLCYTSLSGYNEIHQIEFSATYIKLVNIKDGNSITMHKENKHDYNCYYNSIPELKTENSLIINFDGTLPAIKTGFFSKNINFFKNPAIYKSGKTCLASTTFDLNKVNKICTLKQ